MIITIITIHDNNENCHRSYGVTSKSIVNSVVKTHYRADLKEAALKRFAALHRSTKVLAGTKKAAKSKRGRSKK